MALRSPSGTWAYVQGGDAAPVKFDPDPAHDGKYAYATGPSDYSFFFRSDDGGQTWSDKSVPGKPSVPWYAPFVFHPTDTSRMLVGLGPVYETRNRGDQWKAISRFRAGPDQFVSAMLYAGDDTIYAAYGGRLFRTTNDGGDGSDGNWPEVGTDFGGGIISLALRPVWPPVAHVVIYAATDSGKVWRTTDGADSWEEITGNLPPWPSVSRISVDPGTLFRQAARLYVGTSVGVYAATDQGKITT